MTTRRAAAQGVSGRALQLVLALLGLVAIFFGPFGVFGGLAQVPEAGEVSANVDSEVRFFAAWYVVAGAVLLRAAVRLRAETFAVQVVCAGFFLAACGRLLSWIVAGRPHWSQVGLMILEFVIPAVVLPWHAAVLRSQRLGDQTGCMKASSG
ncbi:MAG: DUF4345 domain-containing protein [Actinomycetota bacterium]